MRENIPDINSGLYRDDGLGFTTGIGSSQLERIKKCITSLFKDNNLEISITMDLFQVDFLDITMSLEKDKFWPYRKPNDEPLYINKLSNHPPNIVLELPKMIEKRVSELSCDVDEFMKCKTLYEDALVRSGYSCKLNYVQPAPKRRNRPRNIIWFNLPYNTQTSTDVGKKFIVLFAKQYQTVNPS